MRVSINAPGDPDLWPFDLETDMLVASKLGETSFRIWARWVFGFSNYSLYCIRDGRTDSRTDKSNAYCPRPTGVA